MRYTIAFIAVLLPSLLLALPAAAQSSADPAQMTQQARIDAISRLGWLGPGQQQLPASHSTIGVSEGYQLVVGDDARRMQELVGNRVTPALEAVVVDDDLLNQVVFESYIEGYVALDDWSSFSAADMVEQVRRDMEASNEARRSKGAPELHLVGWLQEPTLDRDSHTVRWALAARAPTGEIVNAVALVLGRYGFEQLTWITTRDRYAASDGALDTILRRYRFDADFGYGDHDGNDTVAPYRIAGLVTAVAGLRGDRPASPSRLPLVLGVVGAVVVIAGGVGLYLFRHRLRRRAA